MKLVKPSVRRLDTSNQLELIEVVGRTCYKSEDKIGEGTAAKFVQKLIDRGHLAMVEFSNFVFEVTPHVFTWVVGIIDRRFIRLSMDGRYLVSGSARSFIELYIDNRHECSALFISKLKDECPDLFQMIEINIRTRGEILQISNQAHLIDQETLDGREYFVHYCFGYNVVCNRGVTHEIVRHRPFSYAQECVIGSTRVHRNYTIEQLYTRQESGNKFDSTHNKTINLKSVTDNGVIIPHKISKIFCKGVEPVYEVQTKLGYSITCTKSHKFLSSDNVYKQLSNFKVGDYLFTTCHKMLTHGWHLAKQIQLDEICSIEFRGNQKTFDLEMVDPYHNYIANGFAVHNSTRYCNYSGGVKFIIPPWIDLEPGNYSIEDMSIYMFEKNEILRIDDDVKEWLSVLAQSEYYYLRQLKRGWSAQKARGGLVIDLKTEINIYGNVRQWSHFFDLRTSPKAHPQMQEIAVMIREDLKVEGIL